MARLPGPGAAAPAHRRGSHFKAALLGLTVLAAVLGMTSLGPTGLHAELHARTAHEELRLATGARLRATAACGGWRQRLTCRHLPAYRWCIAAAAA